MSNILQINNVSKSFAHGRIRAVSNVSLNIKRGIVTALIGPNGAGKTTFFNLLSGYVRPDGGKIIYYPKKDRRKIDLTRREPWKIARLGIGRLFQDMHTFEHMTVLDNVLSGFRQRAEENFLRTIFGRSKVEDEESENVDSAFDLLEFVGLDREAYSLAGELSFGQQKLLAIARLLATGPELLLLDEPTAGLSVQMVDRMRSLVVQLVRGKWIRKGEGRTVVIIEHNLSFIDDIADWSCVMNEGELTYSGAGGPRLAFKSPDRRSAYIGIHYTA